MLKDHKDGPMAGKLIIVTGASSGVGYATVRRLVVVEGATVVAVARRRVFRIEALAKQVRAGQLLALTGDMANQAEANAIVREITDRFGQIDGFVHAVNRVLRHTALEVSDQEFDLTLQVNVKSALYTVQAIAPTLRRQQHGSIVIYNPSPKETPDFDAAEVVYTASAHALSALTAGWSRQLTPSGVQAAEISPDLVSSASGEPYPTHDQLLVDALRTMLALSLPQQKSAHSFTASHTSMGNSSRTQRGGLTLTCYL